MVTSIIMGVRIIAGNGWISVHRKIQNHWIWKTNKPFDKRSAWIDILLLVNHEPGKIYFNNEVVEVDRGEHITSEVKLADRWGWSRTKVRNFLELLEQDKMIKNIKENGKRTRVRVLNYKQYQISKNRGETGEKQGDSLKKDRIKDNKKTGINYYNNSDYKEIENNKKTSNNTIGKQGNPQKQNTNNNNNNYNKLINNIWSFYCDLFKGIYEPKTFSKKRQGKIKQRLKTYSVDEIKTSLKNMRDNKFLCGDNDKGKVYAKPEYCFRNDEKIEEWLHVKGGNNDRFSKDSGGKETENNRTGQKQEGIPDYDSFFDT